MARPYVSLGSRILREARKLDHYALGGPGTRLLEHDEERLGTAGRFPEHYLRFRREWLKGPQEWIHLTPDERRFEKDEFGQVVPVVNKNITTVFYPDGFHKGLWGGEGVVWGILAPKAARHKPNYNPLSERYWFPRLHQTVVYSEILDVHLAMVATERGESLVDKHKGLDLYLLETPVNEVYAVDLLKLKRCMLLALVRETLYPNNSVRRKEVLDKYKRFMLPEEEADWHGLTIDDAKDKQEMLDRLQREERTRPLKHLYRKELVDSLKAGLYEEAVDPVLLEEGEGTTVRQAFRRIGSAFKRKK